MARLYSPRVLLQRYHLVVCILIQVYCILDGSRHDVYCYLCVLDVPDC